MLQFVELVSNLGWFVCDLVARNETMFILVFLYLLNKTDRGASTATESQETCLQMHSMAFARQNRELSLQR